MLSERDLILCELLLLRARRRDSQAAAQLTALFQQSLLYYIRRILASESDAWDALQESWLIIFRQLHTLREPRAFPAFAYRIARNQALMQLRKGRQDAALLDSLEAAGEESDAAPLEPFTSEDAAAVHRALEHLSLPHREVLTLFFLQDLSIDDIAAVISVPPGTVKSRLFHAKRALRDRLAHYSPPTKGEAHD